MVRRERAPSDTSSFAGGAAPGGGAGRCRGLRPVPARVAGCRSAAAGARRADPGSAAAAGLRHSRLDPRAGRAARPGPGVPLGRPRCPHGERRARLDRSGGARDRRRARHVVVPRGGGGARAGAGRGAGRTGARCDPQPPGRPRSLVLARPRAGSGHGRYGGAVAIALGPRVGRRGHERHARPVAGVRAIGPSPRPHACQTQTRTASSRGTARRRRTVVIGGRSSYRDGRPHRARRRPRREVPRSIRRRDPRSGAGREHSRRVRRRLPGASRDGGIRQGAARLLRGRARGGAVRGAGRGRSAARGSGPRVRGADARRGRPRTAVRCRAALARDRGSGRRAPPARSSCWSTARRRRSSNAAPRRW